MFSNSTRVMSIGMSPSQQTRKITSLPIPLLSGKAESGNNRRIITRLGRVGLSFHLHSPLAPAAPPGTHRATWHPQGVPLLWTGLRRRSMVEAPLVGAWHRRKIGLDIYEKRKVQIERVNT